MVQIGKMQASIARTSMATVLLILLKTQTVMENMMHRIAKDRWDLKVK